MTNLRSTHPHFVRCLIPNETKTPGKKPTFLLTECHVKQWSIVQLLQFATLRSDGELLGHPPAEV